MGETNKETGAETNWLGQAVGCLILLVIVGVTISMLGTGVRNLIEVYQYRTPEPIAFSRLATARPRNGWFTISGGYLDAGDGWFIKEKSATVPLSEVHDIFVPLRDSSILADESGYSDQQIHVLVKTSDPTVLRIFRSLKAGGAAHLSPADTQYLKRPLHGMIGSSLHSVTSEDESVVVKGRPNLASDYIIVDEGAEPSIWLGTGLFASGFILSVVEVLLLIAALRLKPTIEAKSIQSGAIDPVASNVPLEYQMLDAPIVQAQTSIPAEAAAKASVSNVNRPPFTLIQFLGCMASVPVSTGILVMLSLTFIGITDTLHNRNPVAVSQSVVSQRGIAVLAILFVVLIMLLLVALQILIVAAMVKSRKKAIAAALEALSAPETAERPLP